MGCVPTPHLWIPASAGMVYLGAPTVILNGAERSEESKASVRKAAMYLVNGFGFFAFGSE